MPWSRPFDDLISLPGRRELVTLRDAGRYIAALPKAEQELRNFVKLPAADNAPILQCVV